MPLVQELAECLEEGVEAFRSERDSLHQIWHVGEPEGIANGIAFLASEEAKFMTGSEFVIGGGYIAQKHTT